MSTNRQQFTKVYRKTDIHIGVEARLTRVVTGDARAFRGPKEKWHMVPFGVSHKVCGQKERLS